MNPTCVPVLLQVPDQLAAHAGAGAVPKVMFGG